MWTRGLALRGCLAVAANSRHARALRRDLQALVPLVAASRPSARSGTLLARDFASGTDSFQCTNCGQSYAKWQGQCSGCQEWGSVMEMESVEPRYRQSNAASFSKSKTRRVAQSVAWTRSERVVGRNAFEKEAVDLRAHRMNEVELDTFTERVELPERELNWVLGGGLVAGSLTLVAGNPGVGKSTLALQMANMLAEGPTLRKRGVLYVSGEESVLQVRMRAERLGSVSDGLFVASETNLDSVFQLFEVGGSDNSSDSSNFGALVVDSIQTMYVEDVASPAGNVNQVKECTLRLLRLAKSQGVPVILIGHVTKSGDIAGPKVLEHIVDTVVQLEGDPQSARRFLRCQKNRFGNTSEVGVFSMTDMGLLPLANPLLAFVSNGTDSDGDEELKGSLDGCSVTIAMEGRRPIPLEIQALTNRTQFSVDGKSAGAFSRVRGVGVSFDKLQLLFAVMEKRANVSFQHQSVFVNIAEGYHINEPAADLALAVALASAVLDLPVVKRAAFIGEVSLSGHLRPVKMLESRLTAAHKIGLDMCVIPREHDPVVRQALRDKFDGTLRLVEASTLLQALKAAFGTRANGSVVEQARETQH